jgi:hypothetical protein
MQEIIRRQEAAEMLIKMILQDLTNAPKSYSKLPHKMKEGLMQWDYWLGSKQVPVEQMKQNFTQQFIKGGRDKETAKRFANRLVGEIGWGISKVDELLKEFEKGDSSSDYHKELGKNITLIAKVFK